MSASVSVPVAPTGGTVGATLVAHFQASTDFYQLQLAFLTTGNVHLELYKRVSGSFTLLDRHTDLTAFTAGTPLRMRLQARNGVVLGKAWNPSGTEPSSWHVGAVDTTFSVGQVGMQSIVFGTNTNVLPYVFNIDDFTVSNVQNFTVTRAMNTVSKSHAVGAGVNLHQPAYLAL